MMRLLIVAMLTIVMIHAGRSAPAQQPLLTIEPTADQPRNSEGDILELRDGRLCLIYTRFTGGSSDHSAADLAMRISSDGGQTWSDDQIVVRREQTGNVMSVSLLRLSDGRIALFYVRKRSLEDCRPMLRISEDEATTFGPPTLCIADQVGYYVLNNDRVVELSDGRLVMPVALHNVPGAENPDWAGRVMCYLSDDTGKTWRRSKTTLLGHAAEGKRVTVQEPGVVALRDGRLMMFCRTNAGSQFISYSVDRGDTWSELAPSPLASPISPATIERVPWSGELVCVWNDHSGMHPYPADKRSPLCIATSADDGKTWSRSRVIESNPDGWYCYTAMTFLRSHSKTTQPASDAPRTDRAKAVSQLPQEDRMLLAYCAGDKRVGGLNRLKIVSISKEWPADSAGAGPARPAIRPLLGPCLDYGRSFVNTKAPWNSPRFWVESRCLIVDKKVSKSVEYLQCGLCKAERTFAHRDLFPEDNYDFLPVFSSKEGIIFRRHVRVGDPYRDVRPNDAWWGGTENKLQALPGRVLKTADEIFAAMQAGKPIVGQTEIRDEKSGRTAVIEYPVKTINFERNRRDWQVDTGPVLLPDLTASPDAWSHTFRLAHIAFRTPFWADFLVDQPTPLRPAAGPAAQQDQTYHYSGSVHRKTRNVLIVLETP
ncbi:MAG: sialidase family protein [Pirellulales bacterium]